MGFRWCNFGEKIQNSTNDFAGGDSYFHADGALEVFF
jgi:hypothetical protein